MRRESETSCFNPRTLTLTLTTPKKSNTKLGQLNQLSGQCTVRSCNTKLTSKWQTAKPFAAFRKSGNAFATTSPQRRSTQKSRFECSKRWRHRSRSRCRRKRRDWKEVALTAPFQTPANATFNDVNIARRSSRRADDECESASCGLRGTSHESKMGSSDRQRSAARRQAWRSGFLFRMSEQVELWLISCFVV